MITNGFKILKNNFKIILYPIIFDLIPLVIAMMYFYYRGTPKLTFKFTLDIGIPSIFNLLDDVNKFKFMVINIQFLDEYVLLFLIISFFVGAFLKGGFLGLLVQASKKRETNIDVFIKYGLKFWIRFLLTSLIVFFFTILVMLVSSIFGIIGIIGGIVLFLYLRIIYIYWEFTIVLDNIGAIEALERSRTYYLRKPYEAREAIVGYIMMNIGFGIVLNLFPNQVIFIIGIILYSYLATGFLLSILVSLIVAKRTGYDDDLNDEME